MRFHDRFSTSAVCVLDYLWTYGSKYSFTHSKKRRTILIVSTADMIVYISYVPKDILNSLVAIHDLNLPYGLSKQHRGR